jgi:hypothetical protein
VYHQIYIMNVDTIDFVSRNFYETARFKAFAGIMLIGTAFFFLGMTSSDAAMAQFNWYTGKYSNDDEIFAKLRETYGFASFLYFLGFILCGAGGVYYHPSIMGTHNEKSTLSDPIQISGSMGGGQV